MDRLQLLSMTQDELLAFVTDELGESKFRALGLGEPRLFKAPSDEAMRRYRDLVSDLNQ